MAKTNKRAPQKSNTPLIVMVAVAIAVIGLVAWALSRSVDRTPSVAQTATEQAPAAVDTSTFSTPSATATWNPQQTPDGQPQLTLTQPPPASQSGDASVPRMSVEDLKPKFDRGEVTIIDTRDANSYAQSHIPGAIHVPMASVQTMLPSLPKDKPIVAYCT